MDARSHSPRCVGEDLGGKGTKETTHPKVKFTAAVATRAEAVPHADDDDVGGRSGDGTEAGREVTGGGEEDAGPA
jgi:hypothetical protein